MGRNAVTPCTTAKTTIRSNDMPPAPLVALVGRFYTGVRATAIHFARDRS
jgi:hypothetical protein